jgi:ATP-dependent Zn protease
MNEQEFKAAFQNVYTARYPLIAIDTFEEEWAIRILAEHVEERLKASDNRKKVRQIAVWDRAEGWYNALTGLAPEFKIPRSSNQAERTFDVSPNAIANVRNITLQLDNILQYISAQNTKITMFVFLDLENKHDLENPINQRFLKRIAQKIRGTSHTVIMIQPSISIPSSLEKEVTMLDFATPSRADHEEMFNDIIEGHKDNVTLNMSNDGKESLYKSMTGLSSAEYPHMLAEAIVQNNLVVDDNLISLMAEKKKANIRKGGFLQSVDVDETMDDIGGLDNLKKYLEECKLAFTADAGKYGITTPKGFLSVGPPGAGKTMCAKATASVLRLPLIRFDISAVFNSLVGSSEKNISRVQKQLEQNAPAVVLIDEIDKAIAGLKGGGGDSGVGSRILGSLLQFMNDTRAPLFFVGTANSIALPPEILRKGRWDELFFIDLPTAKERRQIFRIHLRKIGRDPKKFDTKQLALLTSQFSGAEISNVIQQGLRKAYYDNADEVQTSHIVEAISQVKPLAKTMKSEIDEIRKFAEDRTRKASSEKEEFSSRTKITNEKGKISFYEDKTNPDEYIEED